MEYNHNRHKELLNKTLTGHDLTKEEAAELEALEEMALYDRGDEEEAEANRRLEEGISKTEAWRERGE